jgi:5-methylcytosine-specific restriction endonuclease McrA
MNNKGKLNLYAGIYGNKSKRVQTKTSQKAVVFDRQGGKCWRCKHRLNLGSVKYHHVIFVSRGGKTKTKNLRALCSNCHDIIHKEEKARAADRGVKKQTISKFGVVR